MNEPFQKPPGSYFLSVSYNPSFISEKAIKNVLPLNRREPQASAKCKRSSIVQVCHCVMHDHTHTMHIYTQSYAYIHMCMTANIYIESKIYVLRTFPFVYGYVTIACVNIFIWSCVIKSAPIFNDM